MNTACNRPARRHRGVGLIEVLVTLLILALGFLAAANMQIRGMRSNQASLQRAQALLSLGDVMDRMRNNPPGVADGHYSGRTTGSLTLPTCVDTGCSSAELADVDMFEWSANLQPLRGETDFIPLLSGVNATTPAVGSISQPVDGVYTLTLSWQGIINGTPAPESMSVNFAP